MSEKETFVYCYSAKQQEEIKTIRDKYLPKENDKLTQMKKLDQSVTRKAAIISIIIGFIFTLIFGVGLCCVLEWDNFIVGIPVGVIGLIGMALAYPVYQKLIRKLRSKVADEIIKLSDELLK
ncbi:MAG: hypothetical protein U0N20_05995 [Clostridium sp.]